MTPRQRRMTLVVGIVAGVGIAGALALSAFRQNVTFYFDPSKVAAGEVKPGEHFRLGGMVVKGSVKREPGSLEVHFVVTDFAHDVPVSYDRVLPDLFREGTGVVALGHLDTHGTFVADEVLAKRLWDTSEQIVAAIGAANVSRTAPGCDPRRLAMHPSLRG